MPKIKALDVVCATAFGLSVFVAIAAPEAETGAQYVALMASAAVLWIMGACAFVKTLTDRF